MEEKRPGEELAPASTGEIVDILRRFSDGLKHIRSRIQDLDDDELIALYEQASNIGNVAWIIRCVVIGTAKSRARRGDGAVKSIAKVFGISERAAQLDIQVYETFIKDNPDFEAELPARFYQIAAVSENPEDAINYAISKKAEAGHYPAAVFEKTMRGEIVREPVPKGIYKLVKVQPEEVETDVEKMPLYGRLYPFVINGELYVRAQ